MNIRRFRVLHEAGASYAEIAGECRVDWRTVKKYLAEDGVALPPGAPARAGTQPQKITGFAEVVDACLRRDITVEASMIHERLVAEHGFTGHYQRVKMYVAAARPRIADELDVHDENRLRGRHRRFEVVPGAQALSFEASLYSVPARRVRAGQTVELRVLSDVVTIHALDGGAARPPRPRPRQLDHRPSHWDGLPDGHPRGTVIELPHRDLTTASAVSVDAPLAGLLPHRRRADVAVATRPLADYAGAGEAVNRR